MLGGSAGAAALQALRRACGASSSESAPPPRDREEQANRSSLEAAEAELDFEIARCAAEAEAAQATGAEAAEVSRAAAARAAAAVERAERAKAAPPSIAPSLPGPIPCGVELTHRGHEVMHDWTQLLSHADEVALEETWQLPPKELFQRILLQINSAKRDMFLNKYNECKDPACPLQTRIAFIHVLKRVAESFLAYLRTIAQAEAQAAAQMAYLSTIAQAEAQAEGAD